MDNKDKAITLLYENDVLSSMIILFGQLQKVQNSNEVIISEDRKTISIREKDKGEMIKFNFDFRDLEKKIFDWFHSGERFLELSIKESEIFRACSHAAYYYLVDNLDSDQTKKNIFILFHEKYFK